MNRYTERSEIMAMGTISRILVYDVRHQGCFLLGDVLREKIVRRVVFTIEFDDSAKIVIDEVMDATSALLRAGDRTRVCLDDLQTEATVRPASNWIVTDSPMLGVAGGVTLLRDGEYFDSVGSLMRATLLQVEGTEKPVLRTEVLRGIIEPVPSVSDDDNQGEQPGFVMDRFEYLHFSRRAYLPALNLTARRVAFRVLYFYRGYRAELITIDQPVNKVTDAIENGDRVWVRLPDASDRRFGMRPVKSLSVRFRNWTGSRKRRRDG